MLWIVLLAISWYPACLFGACISRSAKQNWSNRCLACRSKQDKKSSISDILCFWVPSDRSMSINKLLIVQLFILQVRFGNVKVIMWRSLLRSSAQISRGAIQACGQQEVHTKSPLCDVNGHVHTLAFYGSSVCFWPRNHNNPHVYLAKTVWIHADAVRAFEHQP